MRNEAIRAGIVVGLTFCVLALTGCLTRQMELSYNARQGWSWHEAEPEADEPFMQSDSEWMEDRAKRYERKGKDPERAARLAWEDFYFRYGRLAR